MARSNRPRTPHERRMGTRNGSFARGPLRPLRENNSRVRQLQYAHDQGVLRSLRTRASPPTCPPHRVLPQTKHGSWLNIVENELSSLTRQCVVYKRFGDNVIQRKNTAAWSNTFNETQREVDWKMKISDGHCKLKSVYPKIKT